MSGCRTAPSRNHNGEATEAGGHFGEAPRFALVDIDILKRNVERTKIIATPNQHVTKGKGLVVANFLVTFKPDIVATQEDLAGKGPGYVFVDGGIVTEQSDAYDPKTFIRRCVA